MIPIAHTTESAAVRARWEPIAEVTQFKGTSETHPALSPADEESARRANRLLCAYARATLDRELPTMKFILE